MKEKKQSSGCGLFGFLVIVALLIVAAFAGGWIYLQQSETETRIIIDKSKMKTDTSRAVESGKKMLDNAAKNIEEATQEPDDEPEEQPPENAEPELPGDTL